MAATNFKIREIAIPITPPESDEDNGLQQDRLGGGGIEEGGRRGRGRSGSNHQNTPGPLPVLPDALQEALNRSPPKSRFLIDSPHPELTATGFGESSSTATNTTTILPASSSSSSSSMPNKTDGQRQHSGVGSLLPSLTALTRGSNPSASGSASTSTLGTGGSGSGTRSSFTVFRRSPGSNGHASTPPTTIPRANSSPHDVPTLASTSKVELGYASRNMPTPRSGSRELPSPEVIPPTPEDGSTANRGVKRTKSKSRSKSSSQSRSLRSKTSAESMASTSGSVMGSGAGVGVGARQQAQEDSGVGLGIDVNLDTSLSDAAIEVARTLKDPEEVGDAGVVGIGPSADTAEREVDKLRRRANSTAVDSHHRPKGASASSQTGSSSARRGSDGRRLHSHGKTSGTTSPPSDRDTILGHMDANQQQGSLPTSPSSPSASNSAALHARPSGGEGKSIWKQMSAMAKSIAVRPPKSAQGTGNDDGFSASFGEYSGFGAASENAGRSGVGSGYEADPRSSTSGESGGQISPSARRSSFSGIDTAARRRTKSVMGAIGLGLDDEIEALEARAKAPEQRYPDSEASSNGRTRDGIPTGSRGNSRADRVLMAGTTILAVEDDDVGDDGWHFGDKFTYELSSRRRRLREVGRDPDEISESGESEGGSEISDMEDPTGDYPPPSSRDGYRAHRSGMASSSSTRPPLRTVPSHDDNDVTITPALYAHPQRKASAPPHISEAGSRADAMSSGGRKRLGRPPTTPPDLDLRLPGSSHSGVSNVTKSTVDQAPRTAPMLPSAFPSKPSSSPVDEEASSDSSALSSSSSHLGRSRSLSEAAIRSTSVNTIGSKRTPSSSVQLPTSKAKRSGLSTEVVAEGGSDYSSDTATRSGGGDQGSREASPPPIKHISARKRSGSTGSMLKGMHASKRGPADMVIAVVGPRGVGKSTIIKKGLGRPLDKYVVLSEDLSKNQVTSYSVKFSIEGISRNVEILEVDTAILQHSAEGLIWPRYLPPLDGAMLCYDASDANALPALITLLRSFWTRGGISLIVLACKSSLHGEGSDAVDPDRAAETCNIYHAGMVQIDGESEESSRKMQKSFHWMIKSITKSHGEFSRPESRSSRHTASSSRVAKVAAQPSSQTPHPTPLPADSSAGLSKTGRHQPTLNALGLPMVSSPPLGENLAMDEQTGVAASAEPDGAEPPQTHVHTEQTAVRKSLSADDVQPHSTREPVPNAETTIRPAAPLANRLDMYFSRDALIDKFLFAAVTDNDTQFVTLFLIVFRRFTRPHDVLSKLIEKYNFVSSRIRTDPLLSRYAHMKLCAALVAWLDQYPGDFVAPATFALLKPFLESLVITVHVAHYAIELLPLLTGVSRMHDPESTWALPDRVDTEMAFSSPTPHTAQDRKMSLVPSLTSTRSGSSMQHGTSTDAHTTSLTVPSTLSDGETMPPYAKDGAASHETLPKTSSDLQVKQGYAGLTRDRSKSDAGTSSSRDAPASTSSSIGQVPSRINVLLDMSNRVAELPDDLLAAQITRMCWEIYSDMKPRDLIRYVLAPRDPKNPSVAHRDSRGPVARAIALSNQISDWVCCMILVQTKLKARARMLEKFMTLAYCLRDRDNFDGLMAILAGLTSQPIFRLDSTLDLVKAKPAHKRFLSLKKLMSTNKAFAAYRLALTGASSQMIPYLGVHLQDITRVNEGKTDMKDGQVNWTKFRQMGKTAAIVLDCPRLAPEIAERREIEALIMADLPDRDAQFDMSYQIKPRNLSHSSSKNKLRRFLEGRGSAA